MLCEIWKFYHKLLCKHHNLMNYGSYCCINETPHWLLVNLWCFCVLSVGLGREGEAALGEGEEPVEGQHRGEQGEDAEARELLDRSADPLPHRQRTPEGGPGPVPDSGEEVQQGQETHQRLSAEVSDPGFNYGNEHISEIKSLFLFYINLRQN